MMKSLTGKAFRFMVRPGRRDKIAKRLASSKLVEVEPGGADSKKGLRQEVASFDNRYQFRPRQDRIDEHLKTALKLLSGKKKIRILEIGPEGNPREYIFKGINHEYFAIDFDQEKVKDNVIIGNIEDCPEIKDESFDLIISVDVFEHISRPWLAGKEIGRILKKGGVTYHTTLFSWRYHKDPEDYWRYSPAALDVIFSGLEKIQSEFDDSERRRNIIGRASTRIRPDEFGGWRENWRVHGIYRKK